jgi:hypothetical protein
VRHSSLCLVHAMSGLCALFRLASLCTPGVVGGMLIMPSMSQLVTNSRLFFDVNSLICNLKEFRCQTLSIMPFWSATARSKFAQTTRPWSIDALHLAIHKYLCVSSCTITTESTWQASLTIACDRKCQHQVECLDDMSLLTLTSVDCFRLGGKVCG